MSLIPVCCEPKLPSLAFGMRRGVYWGLVFVGWIAVFPLSFFKVSGRAIAVVIFLLVSVVAIVKYGLGLMALEPLLALAIGLFVAMAH